MVGNGHGELFSERVRARGRTYFFDVREAKRGDRYLVISEFRRTPDGHARSRVVVFPDALGRFLEVLRRAAQVIEESGRSRPIGVRRGR